MSDLFFTSDEHYGHKKIIEFCNRPFASVEEMTERMVENHNAKVSKGSRVYHLGDMFFKMHHMDALKVLDRLNGQHYLVLGNHDEIVDQIAHKFVWVKPFFELKVNKHPVTLFHYPMRTWKRREYGAWHLYGHVHGRFDSEPYGLSFDVGVDSWNYEPVSYEEVSAKMALLKE